MIDRKLPFESINREILVKKESSTSPKYGCDPSKRPVPKLIENGIVNLDKPAGPTSHQVSAYLKQILGLSKAGHSGTLDPNVTGVLPVCLLGATKAVHTLLSAGKEYVCVMHMHKELTETEVRNACAAFSGKIKQLPPVKSAVKRQIREREIYYLDIMEIEGKDVLFRTGVQGGTYIRKLVDDIGKKVGGAHMAELRRTKAGPFKEDTLATLQDVADAWHYYKSQGNDKFIRKIVQPVENGIVHLPKIWIVDSAVDTISHGASLKIPGISKLESGINKEDTVAVLTLKGELVCYGTARMTSDEIMEAHRGMAVKTERVFMDRGTYPKTEI